MTENVARAGAPERDGEDRESRIHRLGSQLDEILLEVEKSVQPEIQAFEKERVESLADIRGMVLWR